MPCAHRDRVAWLATACLLAVTAACGPSKQRASKPEPTLPGTAIGAPASQPIGIEGGTISSPDGRVKVRIPPGAIPAATTFSVQEITNTAPSGLGSAYRLGPEGTTFLRPVSFTFVAGWSGAEMARLTIATRDAQGFWNNAPSVTRNVGAKTLTVATTHFSDWAIVSADPARDMAGSFTLQSTTDLPLTAQGNATLTYAGQDSAERWYVFSGTTTLQEPVSSGGVACTPDDGPVYAFPTNVAQVLNSPDRFWWGTSAHWSLTCGATPTVATTAFDTQGINFLGCARSYSGTPIITLDRLQGAYTIDCGARGAVSATWDFFRCGGGCTSPNVCRTAEISCASGSPVCTMTGNVPNGTSCGTDAVCGNGTCNACVEAAPCTPANACHVGAISCASGFPVCVDTNAAVANGSACGTNQVCNAGTCSACTAGASCPFAENVCHLGTTSCATGVETCIDSLTPAADGTACGSNLVCSGGSCTACTAGVACTPPDDPCHAGVTSCATGTSVCVATTTPVADGTACPDPLSGPGFCTAGSCTACPTGAACAPTNVCRVGAVADCAGGAPRCAETGANVENGTACGSNLVCNEGTCSACTAGASCTPANPCHVGATSCATGVETCVDTGAPLNDGATCGTDQVCSAGACSACAAGAACTPAGNACHAGAISCTTGSPVCTDLGTPLANGTGCGTGQVCSGGTCASCIQDAACTLANACVASAAIECGSGSPVCTARSSVPDATLCGEGLACSGGSCLTSPCVASAACVPANPCHLGAVTCGPPDACSDTGASAPDGTVCGGDLVCKGGSCTACPGAEGAACAPTNPCATAAAISCAGGTPACADTAFVLDGTACGSNLTCVQGVCQ